MNSNLQWTKRQNLIAKLLIEKFVSGRELTIGILGDQALPILEIIPKGGFYDFNNKYPFLNPQAGGEREHVCPANIDAGKTKKIQELALRAFRAARSAGVRACGRNSIRQRTALHLGDQYDSRNDRD